MTEHNMFPTCDDCGSPILPLEATEESEGEGGTSCYQCANKMI